MNIRLLISFLSIASTLVACYSKHDPRITQKKYRNQSTSAFDDYWYGGKAELNLYELNQERYGELRKGHAVLIFVTEDFLTDAQVKKEKETNQHSTSVLKINQLRKFNTGIYDYSTMGSVFSPVKQHTPSSPIKSTFSAQEWCGQTWLQFNQRSGGYEVAGYSYFQQEGDVRRVLQQVYLEDGLWNQIRLNPELIESGEVQMVPSGQFIRFKHISIQPFAANLSTVAYQGEEFQGNDLMVLKLQYSDIERALSIYYEKEFPHFIVGWKEGNTTAKIKRKLKLDYWNKNSVQDSVFRKELGLAL
jgi:hypothetical protein